MLTIFMLISFLGVVAVVRQIIGNQKHLTDDIIRRFLLNQLSEREQDRTTAHLGICEACQERLHNFGKQRPLEDHLIDPKE
jgi:anti-sigma factor RsiW